WFTQSRSGTISLLLRLCVRSSSFRVRLALLGNLGLGRCSDDGINSRRLFLDDRDVSHRCGLFAKEPDASRVRQVGDMDDSMQLQARNIDVQVARDVARQAL